MVAVAIPNIPIRKVMKRTWDYDAGCLISTVFGLTFQGAKDFETRAEMSGILTLPSRDNETRTPQRHSFHGCDHSSLDRVVQDKAISLDGYRFDELYASYLGIQRNMMRRWFRQQFPSTSTSCTLGTDPAVVLLARCTSPT